jgi:hypothetical protein
MRVTTMKVVLISGKRGTWGWKRVRVQWKSCASSGGWFFSRAQDTRFKAATTGASQSNVLAGYGTDGYEYEDEAVLGTPWKKAGTRIRLSFPFLYADKNITPTLSCAGKRISMSYC